MEFCTAKALTFSDDQVKWNESLCTGCDECIKNCPTDSTPKVREMTISDIISELEPIKSFIRGITVSGGECTLQNRALIELFSEVKKLNLTGYVDTNGAIDFLEMEELIDLMDGAMVDLKSFDLDEHLRLTGKENSNVIMNIKYLGSIGKLLEVRTVVVPELLDNKATVEKTANLLASIDPSIRYKLIKYRPLGVREKVIDAHEPSDEQMKNLLQIAKAMGLEDVVIV